MQSQDSGTPDVDGHPLPDGDADASPDSNPVPSTDNDKDDANVAPQTSEKTLAKHHRNENGTATPGRQRHANKSDMTSDGTPPSRGAHHTVPVRRREGVISGCLGVLPVIRRDSFELAEDDDKMSRDRPTVEPSSAGCSRVEATDVVTTPSPPTPPPPAAPPPPVRSGSSSDTETSSSEWSTILEKVRALTTAVTTTMPPPQPPFRVDRLPSIGSCCCRICQSSNSPEQLISPCRCKGSLAYVHLSCLERWLNQSGRTYCELCQFRFNATQTPRYRLLQGMRLWYCHPRHRRQLLADALIAVILSCVTLGLVSIIILGMRYFIIEGAKLGISAQCTQFTITFFLAVVTSGYIVTMYLLIKDQITPWMHWWRTNVNVRVVLDADASQPLPHPAQNRLAK